jgi:ABC-2 type transport system permease protein
MNWWHLTRKDLTLQLRDLRSLVVLLLMPLIFIAIVGLSTGQLLGWRDQNQVIRVAWVDHDRGDLATRLRERLDQREEVEVVQFTDQDAASRAVFRGDCTLLVVVGGQFRTKLEELQLRDFLAWTKGYGQLMSGLSAFDIRVETKPSWGWVSRLVSDALYSLALADVFPEVAKRNNLARMLMRNTLASMEKEGTDSISKTVESPIPQQSSVQTTIGEGEPTRTTLYDTLVPGFTVMFAFYLIMTMARSFISERDLGTLRRLRLSPLTSTGLVVGKTLPFLVVSLLQSFSTCRGGHIPCG